MALKVKLVAPDSTGSALHVGTKIDSASDKVVKKFRLRNRAIIRRVLDKQASMLATICLFAWLVRGRCLFACEINCLLASACKHYSSIRA